MSDQISTQTTNEAPENVAVWFEIPVRDLEKSKVFYGTVLQSDLRTEDMGNGDIAVFATRNGGVGGHLYVDRDNAGVGAQIVHMGTPDALEKSLDRAVSAGGSVVSDIITLPSGGRFAYCTDVDGNRFGLFSG